MLPLSALGAHDVRARQTRRGWRRHDTGSAHDVLGKVVDTLAAEYAAGRGMVNRVLRVSLHGANEFFESHEQRR